MPKNKLLLTEEGLQKLKDRFRNLIKEYMEVSATKGEAAELGGDVWHDNPAFEEVEHRQTMIQKQIADLSEQLRNAEIVGGKDRSNKAVSIGSVVEIVFDNGNAMKIKIGGHAETDPSKGIVSYQSPLGLALVGAKVGDNCEYKVRDKVIRVTIKSITG